jgi:hypothetical protein
MVERDCPMERYEDLLTVAGMFFVFYVMKNLFDGWFSKTNRNYVTVERCEENRSTCNKRQTHTNNKLMAQINTLKIITVRIAHKLGVMSEEDMAKLLRSDIDDESGGGPC